MQSVAGALAAATVPVASTAAVKRASDAFDVIVIGGGFAGAAAARETQKAGLHTLLLEAKSRLGGRTFYTKFGEDHIDVGGAWVHWVQPFVWAEKERYGLAVEEIAGASPERFLWAVDGKVKEVPIEQGVTLAAELYAKFHEGASTAFPRPFEPFVSGNWREMDTKSVKDRLDDMKLPADQRALLSGILQTSCSGPLGQASLAEMLRWYALSGNDFLRLLDATARFKFSKGTASLIDAMIDDGRPTVKLAAPVTTVVQQAQGVRVTTEDGKTYQARSVIVTVPMNVLKDIEFSPPLNSAKIVASKERHAGQGQKAYIRIKGKAPNLMFVGGEGEAISMFFANSIGPEASMFIAFSPDTNLFDFNDGNAVQAFVDRVLPGHRVDNVMSYAWHLDQYSQGTWAVFRPQQATRYLQALKKTEGSVYFASADSADGWRGFIDGAIEAGIKTGQEVVRAHLPAVAKASHG
jgi:monoamine oxidase